MFAYMVNTKGRDVLVNTSMVRDVTFSVSGDKRVAILQYKDGETLIVNGNDGIGMLEELNAPTRANAVEIPGSSGVYVNPDKVVEAGLIWKGVGEGESPTAAYLVFDNGIRREFNAPPGKGGESIIKALFPEPVEDDEDNAEPRDQQDKDNR